MCTQNSNSQSPPNLPIVLLHGWGMNKTVWQPSIDNLPEGVAKRVIALDLPGYGQHNNYTGGYSLSDLANWLNQQLESYGPVILVGWSLGGLIAQKFAIDYPNKVHQLNLIGSTPKFMANDEWHGIKPEVLTMFAEQLVTNSKQTIERFLAIQAMGSRTARDDIKQLKELILSAPAPDATALAKGLELLEREDLRAQWSQLECPVHALFGKLDSLVPFKAIKDIENLGGSPNLEILEKSSHAPFISHPEAFLDWFMKSMN